MTKKNAFTLIELLVVIAVIALLVGILLPSLNRARELAKRATCGANLNGIGKAMYLYSTNYGGMFPTSPCQIWGRDPSYTQWTGKVGTYRTSAVAPPSDCTDNSVSASWWLLLRKGYVSPKSFICGSTDDIEDGLDGGSASDLWDFEVYNNFSYSMQMPYGKTLMHISLPAGRGIMADKSPLFDSSTGALTGVSIKDATATGTTQAQIESNNSHNHSQDGQNVMYLDAHVKWVVNANAGIGADHIYSRYDPDASGNASNPKIGTVGNNCGTYTEEDTLLVH